MRTLSVAQTRNRLTELLRDVEQGAPVAISRRGKPVAVLLAEPDYVRLQSAAVHADFGGWLQSWRGRVGVDFEGISAEDLMRWNTDD